MDEITLNAKLRSTSGKGTAHKLRAVGMIPGIFYLGQEQNQPIQVNVHELQLVLKRKPSVLRLRFDDGTEHECVIRELQQHPVSGRSLHIDFMGIVRGKRVTVQVAVELVGSAFGVRTQGGVLQHTIHAVHVECFPRDIPEKLTLDISELKVGSSLHVRDIVSENIRILDDPDKTVVSILAPKIEKEVEEVAPEVVEGEAAEAEGEGEKEENE